KSRTQNYMPHDLPALRRREALGVALAQVVGVRLCRVAERPDNNHRVGVDVGESGDGILIASDLAAWTTRILAHRERYSTGSLEPGAEATPKRRRLIDGP